MNTTPSSLKALLLLAALLPVLLAACTTPTVDPKSRPADFEAFVNDLKAAGAQVEMAESNQDPFFSVPGQTIKVNGKSVIVYQYSNEAARAAESDTISPDGFRVGNSMVDWVDPPHFWASGRITVLYVGKDQATLNLLTQRLGDPLTKPE